MQKKRMNEVWDTVFKPKLKKGDKVRVVGIKDKEFLGFNGRVGYVEEVSPRIHLCYSVVFSGKPLVTLRFSREELIKVE